MASTNGNKIELPDLMNQLGGWYQFRQHALHGMAWLLFGVHMMGFVFVFPVVEHRCFVKEVDNGEYFNGTIDTNDIGTYIPRNDKGRFESCLKYGNSNIRPCDEGYVYNYSVYHSSRVADWDMVCDKTWMRALLQSIFLVGTLIGCGICGRLSDMFGRKPLFCVSGVMQLLFSLAGAFLDNYYAFAASMFGLGFFGGAGSVVPSVALTMELVSPSARNICGTMFTVWLNIGSLLVVTWAYFLPIPAKTLQLICALHSLLLCGHFWFMDESICWLWSNGKKYKAIELVSKAVKQKKSDSKDRRNNGLAFAYSNPCYAEELSGCESLKTNSNQINIPDANSVVPKPETVTSAATTSTGSSVQIRDLFCYPKLRSRTLVMLYIWLASALIYFGLSFNSVTISKNPYLMFIINVLVEIPGHLISVFVQTKTGNKIMLFFSLLLSGIACTGIPFLPDGIVSIYVLMLAKIAATVTFNLINSYTTELFPTCIRNTAVGLCVMFARAGAALIPWLNLLSVQAELIPTVTFGVVGILGSFLCILLLPETMNRDIPQTIEDVENFGKNESQANKVSIS